jgi:hypothetical protein
MRKTPPTIHYSKLRYERISPYRGKVPRIWVQESIYKSFFKDLLNDIWKLLKWLKRIYRKELVVGAILLLALLPEPHQVKAVDVPEAPAYIQPIEHLEPVAGVPMVVSEVAPVPEPVAPVVPSLASGSHTDWMAAAGISPSDYSYADYIMDHESSWNYLAVNSIGATGVCQSLPGSKMASAGADYLTNPITQLRWCNSYAAKYGGWYGSYIFWVANHYW